MPAVRINTLERPWLPTRPPLGEQPTARVESGWRYERPQRSSYRPLHEDEFLGETFESEEERETGRFEVIEATGSIPPARETPVLVRMDGHGAGAVRTIPPGGIVLGRSPSADLQIDDAGVSRKHARLHLKSGEIWLEDLGSRNGCYVGGRNVTSLQLRDGDCLQLGPRVSFRFSLMDGQQKSMLERLYSSSILDPLTGAHNRRHGEERLAAEIAYAVRHRSMLSVILVDLDHFKRVNDEHGHQAGDAVLKHLAKLAKRELRTEDVFARYGGEEFLVIVRNVDLNGAFCAAERIRSVVGRSPVDHEGKQIPVTLSAGCASLDCVTAPTAQELIAVADARLYEAKNRGRNCVVIDPI
ncbi:MAG: GGDEF domain-containing protein [Polyangiaceae bacterium]|nr:GGDEF domain-containing protein [Polyangiaceae bacterium]